MRTPSTEEKLAGRNGEKANFTSHAAAAGSSSFHFFLRRKLSFLKSSQLFPELAFRRHSLLTLVHRHQCSPPSDDGLSSSSSRSRPQVRHGTAQSKWRLDTPQCVTPRTRRNRKNGAPPFSGTGNSTKSNVPRTVPQAATGSTYFSARADRFFNGTHTTFPTRIRRSKRLHGRNIKIRSI